MARTLRQRARNRTHQAFQPQVRAANQAVAGARDDLHDEVGSLNSMNTALQHSLGNAAQMARHSGMRPRDVASVLRELAMRRVDATAGTNFQIGQAREEGMDAIQTARQGVQDVASAEATARQDLLAKLREGRQDMRADALNDQRDLRNSILLGVLKGDINLPGAGGPAGLKALGDGGMTPTQRRDQAQSRDTAAFYAKGFFQTAKKKAADPPPGDEEKYAMFAGDPDNWDDEAWGKLTQLVAQQSDVDSAADAERAIARIRENVTGAQLQAAGPIATNPGYHGDLAVKTPVETPTAQAPNPIAALLAAASGRQSTGGISMEDLLRLATRR